MHLISKFNEGTCFLLCFIDSFCKYSWVIPLKDSFERGIIITDAFQKISKWSYRKPNKIWIDKICEFYKRLMKSWLEKHDIEMYWTHNERKSVVAEIFITTLKNKIYKYMTSISKNVYINKLDDTVNTYNKTHHRTIKMKPVDTKSNTYINSSKEFKDKDTKFKVSSIVRILFWQKTMFQIGLKKFSWLKRLNTVPWTYVFSELNGEEIVGMFCERELQKTNQKLFRVEKVIKRKTNKLSVKWKGHNNFFNSWID